MLSVTICDQKYKMIQWFFFSLAKRCREEQSMYWVLCNRQKWANSLAMELFTNFEGIIENLNIIPKYSAQLDLNCTVTSYLTHILFQVATSFVIWQREL